MKVILNLDGSVEFDVDTVEEAVALARTIRNGNGSSPASTPKKRPAPQGDAPPSPLSPQLLATWQYLVDHPSGVTIPEIAQEYGLKSAAANYRLASLAKLGLAHRIKAGVYAPGEG